MTSMSRWLAKASTEDLVKAFREAAKELGCNRSEQRFQEAPFAIGRYKPVKEPSKRSKSSRKVARRR
jgi:hypothetical protein